MLPRAARARFTMPAMLTCSRAASCFSRHASIFARTPTNEAMRCLKMAACCRPLPFGRQRARPGNASTTTDDKENDDGDDEGDDDEEESEAPPSRARRARRVSSPSSCCCCWWLGAREHGPGGRRREGGDGGREAIVKASRQMSPQSSSAPSPVGECANPSRRHTSSHPCSSYSKAPTSTAR